MDPSNWSGGLAGVLVVQALYANLVNNVQPRSTSDMLRRGLPNLPPSGRNRSHSAKETRSQPFMYDTYCSISVEGRNGWRSKAQRTLVCKRTANPQWHHLMHFTLQGADHLVIKVKAGGLLSHSLVLGTATISIHDLIDGAVHEFLQPLLPEGTISLRLQLFDESSLFGLPLADVCNREKQAVPLLVTRCIAEIDARGLDAVGLYRVAGRVVTVKRLCDEFIHDSAHAAIDREAIPSISCLTDLLKTYFRELPEPLFTSHLFPSFMDAASASISDEHRIRYFAGAIAALPKQNFATVTVFFEHLKRVLQHADANRMSANGLAICLGPGLLTPPAASIEETSFNIGTQNFVIEYLLTNWDAIKASLSIPSVEASEPIHEASPMLEQLPESQSVSEAHSPKGKRSSGRSKAPPRRSLTLNDIDPSNPPRSASPRQSRGRQSQLIFDSDSVCLNEPAADGSVSADNSNGAVLPSTAAADSACHPNITMRGKNSSSRQSSLKHSHSLQEVDKRSDSPVSDADNRKPSPPPSRLRRAKHVNPKTALRRNILLKRHIRLRSQEKVDEPPSQGRARFSIHRLNGRSFDETSDIPYMTRESIRSPRVSLVPATDDASSLDSSLLSQSSSTSRARFSSVRRDGQSFSEPFGVARFKEYAQRSLDRSDESSPFLQVPDGAVSPSPTPSPVDETKALNAIIRMESGETVTSEEFSDLCNSIGLTVVPTTETQATSRSLQDWQQAQIAAQLQEIQATALARAASMLNPKKTTTLLSFQRKIASAQFEKHAVSNHINAVQFRKLCYDLGYYIAERDRSLFDELDKNHDGFLNADDMLNWWDEFGDQILGTFRLTLSKLYSFQQYIKLFQDLDIGLRGALTSYQFTQLHASLLARRCTCPPLDVCLEYFATNTPDGAHDGKRTVQFNQFVKLIVDSATPVRDRAPATGTRRGNKGSLSRLPNIDENSQDSLPNTADVSHTDSRTDLPPTVPEASERYSDDLYEIDDDEDEDEDEDDENEEDEDDEECEQEEYEETDNQEQTGDEQHSVDFNATIQSCDDSLLDTSPEVSYDGTQVANLPASPLYPASAPGQANSDYVATHTHPSVLEVPQAPDSVRSDSGHARSSPSSELDMSVLDRRKVIEDDIGESDI